MATANGLRRVVVGLDGSRASHRAAVFLARLAPARGARATCVRVVEPARLPAMPLLPAAMRARIAREADRLERSRYAAARRQVQAAAALLSRAGWRARGVVRTGVPLPELLAAVREARADTLVVGARGAGAVKGFLLGSVAEGARDQAPIDVLIVK